MHAVAAYKRHARLREEFLQRRYNSNYSAVVPWDHRSHVYVWDWFPPIFSCPWRDRLGRFADGGKVVCNWQALARMGEACTVVSVGVQKEVSFETELASRTRCQIHAFDHTVPKLPNARTVEQTVVRPCDGVGRGGAISFRKLGLGSNLHQPGEASMLRTFDELTSSLGRIDLLKIDCEGCEWAVFRQLQRAGSLARVDQLLIELHLSDRRGHSLGIKEVADLFAACEEAGLYPFSSEPNWRPAAVLNQKPWAIEYSFVRATAEAMRTQPYNYVSDPTTTCEANSDPCEARPECRHSKVGKNLAPDRRRTQAVADKGDKSSPGRRIPKLVWQTYKNCNLSAPAVANNEAMRLRNPGYAFHFYDDATAEAFIRSHFVPYVANAFVSLTSGIARADLWRYCVLFVYGGVYVDVDVKLKHPLDSILRPDDAAFLSLESAWWPGKDIAEILEALLGVRAKGVESIPGQSQTDRRRHGLPNNKFAQFMLAFEPRHALLYAMVLETARAVHRWKDTATSQKLKLRTKLLWLTGPSAFTLVIHRMTAAGQLMIDRSHLWGDQRNFNQTLPSNQELALEVPPGCPQAIRLAGSSDFHDEAIRKFVPYYADGIKEGYAKEGYWRVSGPMKSSESKLERPPTPPAQGASLLRDLATQGTRVLGCTPRGLAANSMLTTREAGPESAAHRLTPVQPAKKPLSPPKPWSDPWLVLDRVAFDAQQRRGGCKDLHTSCKAWMFAGVCDTDPSFMELGCRRSCHGCPKDALSAQVAAQVADAARVAAQ